MCNEQYACICNKWSDFYGVLGEKYVLYIKVCKENKARKLYLWSK